MFRIHAGLSVGTSNISFKVKVRSQEIIKKTMVFVFLFIICIVKRIWKAFYYLCKISLVFNACDYDSFCNCLLRSYYVQSTREAMMNKSWCSSSSYYSLEDIKMVLIKYYINEDKNITWISTIWRQKIVYGDLT